MVISRKDLTKQQKWKLKNSHFGQLVRDKDIKFPFVFLQHRHFESLSDIEKEVIPKLKLNYKYLLLTYECLFTENLLLSRGEIESGLNCKISICDTERICDGNTYFEKVSHYLSMEMKRYIKNEI